LTLLCPVHGQINSFGELFDTEINRPTPRYDAFRDVKGREKPDSLHVDPGLRVIENEILG
jgi:hypothetical protein